LAHTDYCPFWDEILNQDLNRAIFPSKSWTSLVKSEFGREKVLWHQGYGSLSYRRDNANVAYGNLFLSSHCQNANQHRIQWSPQPTIGKKIESTCIPCAQQSKICFFTQRSTWILDCLSCQTSSDSEHMKRLSLLQGLTVPILLWVRISALLIHDIFRTNIFRQHVKFTHIKKSHWKQVQVLQMIKGMLYSSAIKPLARRFEK
jgi:hypothetical protein